VERLERVYDIPKGGILFALDEGSSLVKMTKEASVEGASLVKMTKEASSNSHSLGMTCAV